MLQGRDDMRVGVHGPFQIEVKDADFHTFNIAGWPVELVYSRQDLEGLNWELDLAPTD